MAAVKPFFVLLFVLLLNGQGLAQAPQCQPATNINISVTKTGQLVKGAPEYNVVIRNTCPVCVFADVYVKCDGFDNTIEPVDPFTFKKEGDGTCLVKGGAGFRQSDPIQFKFASQEPINFA
ncbi:hypothetical protein NMG60_11033246, partial [Bertholletia excelsa]